MPISSLALLEVWERVYAQPIAVRALELVALVQPEASRDGLESMTVGARDRVLIALRSALFGTVFSSLARCESCAEPLELNFDASEIMTPEIQPIEPLEIVLNGSRVRFRVPSSLDLIAVSSLQSAEQVRSKLLERCLLETEHLKHETVLQDGELKTAITQAMLQADPQALIELQLNCPNCGHTWTALFDIANFLWRELDAWARRTLRDVHKLASAYGWSETQILALSPTRRRLYLELVSP